jgi:hydrogenase maturation protease
VLGLGNPLLTDDGVGLRVAREVSEVLAGVPGVEVDVDFHGGLRLMERIIGFERVIIIDAAQTGGEPGTIGVLAPGDLPTRRSASAHDVNLPTALAVGRRSGARLPADDRITLIAIEVHDTTTFSESCTAAVETAVPRAVALVMETLGIEEVRSRP